MSNDKSIKELIQTFSIRERLDKKALRDELLFMLNWYATTTANEKDRELLTQTIDFITENIESITVSKKGEYKAKLKTQVDKKEVERYLNSEWVSGLLRLILIKHIPTDLERLTKQPRELLKTVARNISNSSEPSLFSLPQKIEPQPQPGINVREEISRNCSALAFHLMDLYQQNGAKPLEITNLSPLSEKIGCTNHRLKLYLLYLGGYVYPIVSRDEKTGGLILTNEQLFKIEFHYSSAVADKYDVQGDTIIGADRISRGVLSFIENEPIDQITVNPSPLFKKALEGKGLGNILTVSDKFVPLILELSDIATKLYTYSVSNKPTKTIKEENLIKDLNLTKQVKAQGKPRVRATILKGLQELKERGHIKDFSFDPIKGQYKYSYSERYVRYKQTRKEKQSQTPKEGVQ